MLERRKFVRIPDQSEISYKILPSPKNEMFLTKDISQGGIRFFVQEFVPKDSLLEIKLTLNKASFSFKAIVKSRWISEDPSGERYEIGVEFVNIPLEATEHLISYIESFLKENTT